MPLFGKLRMRRNKTVEILIGHRQAEHGPQAVSGIPYQFICRFVNGSRLI